MSGHRGLVPGVTNPHPLIATLPGLYQDDRFVQGWMAALDEVLAPVFIALDALPAYLDPRLTPEDFLPWLADWVGIDLDPSWPLGRRRAAVADAVALYRRRGTAGGIATAVLSAVGALPEVRDSGGTAVSTAAGSAPPGDAEPWVEVLIPRGPDGTAPDLAAARQAVARAVPAHVPYRVEVVDHGAKSAGRREPEP